MGRQQTAKSAVFIKAIQKGKDDRKSATGEETFAENPVFRAENKQRDQNPKSGVTL